jgi:hypothetical protein
MSRGVYKVTCLRVHGSLVHECTPWALCPRAWPLSSLSSPTIQPEPECRHLGSSAHVARTLGILPERGMPVKGKRLGNWNLRVEKHRFSTMELPQQHTTSLTGSRLREPQAQGSSRWTFGTVAASRAIGAVASVHAAAKAGEPRSAP